jgi:hypothetical protein
VGSLAATPAESATLVVLLMLLGLMITSPSISIVSAGVVVSPTRHRYPESIRMVSSRWHVHSFISQMEHFGNIVDDAQWSYGRQHVVTMGDYIIPIDIVNGLPYTHASVH